MTKFLNVYLRAAVLLLALLMVPAGRGADRALRSSGMTVQRGQTNRIVISLGSLGDENSIGFSLCFDTNLLTAVRAVRGSGISNLFPTASFSPNLLESTNGRVGIFIGLSTGQAWPAEATNKVVEVFFRATPGFGLVSTTVGYCDGPVAREVSSTNAMSLPTLYEDVPVSIEGVCRYALSTNAAALTSTEGDGFVAITADPGCAWTVANTNTWITITSPVDGVGNGGVDFFVEANPDLSPRSAVLTIAGQTFTVNQAGYVCEYLVDPLNRLHGFVTETGQVSVVAAGLCAWQVVNTNGWITIASATNGLGDGTVTYVVDANPTALERTGIFTIAGQEFVATQSGADCTFVLAPSSAAHAAGSETGTVAVTTLEGCLWLAASSTPWIAILSPFQNTNDGTVTYSLEANVSSDSRTGLVSIAGQDFIITQSGAACAFVLATNVAAFGSGSATGTVAVTTQDGCVWTAVSTNAWISILSGVDHTNSSSVVFSVAANPAVTARTGLVSIAGQEFTVTQSGAPCTFVLAPTGASMGYGSETSTVVVTTLDGCAWNVSNTNAWIDILSASSSTNSGSVIYRVLSNPTALPRSGLVSIAGQNFTVTQSGAPCSFALAPGSGAHGANAATGSVAVTTLVGCTWSVVNTNPWISILAGSPGTNSASVTYRVLANPTAFARTGLVSVAGQEFTVTQTGVPCTYVLSPTQRTHLASAASNFISVTALAGCDWSAFTTNSWLTFPVATNGSGSGVVEYDVAPNPDPAARVGALFIGGQMFVITQQALVCEFSLGPVNRAHGHDAVTNTVAVTANASGCAWTASTTNNWIILAGTIGTGNGVVTYALAANLNSAARTGEVFVADKVFTVTQDGAPCSFQLTPTVANFNFNSATGSVAVTTPGGCAWTATSTNTWITILSPASSTNSGSVAYALVGNPGIINRTGAVLIADQVLTVVQSGAPCSFVVSPLSQTNISSAMTGTVSVTTLAGCVWTVENTNSWIAILSNVTATNSGSVTYALESNPNIVARTGLITVAGQVVTVVQRGAACTFTLSTSNLTHGPGALTNSVSLTTLDGCAWGVTTVSGWITILSPINNTNSGSVSYALAANPAGLARTGVVTIAGQELTLVQQAAPCTYDLSPATRTHDFLGASNSVVLTTLAGCSWNAISTNAWITITAPTNGTGSATISYVVASNTFTYSRTGSVLVAGQLLTIEQGPAPCAYAITPSNATHGAGAESGLFSVATSANCAWDASTAASWITISSATNNVGPGDVAYTLALNPAGAARTGFITAAGKSFAVTQQGQPCMFTVLPLKQTFTPSPGTGVVDVTTLAGCNWTITTTNHWITILSGTNQTGSGSAAYAVAANPLLVDRMGYVSVADQTLVITQQAAICSYEITPTERSHGSGSETGLVSIIADTNCVWEVVDNTPWINILSELTGTNNGSLTYSVQANPTSLVRTGVVSISGHDFTVTQAGAACTFVLGSNNAAHGAGLETNAVTVTTLIGCPWSVVSTNAWIEILSAASSTNSGVTSYRVLANPTSIGRTGVVNIAGQAFTVTQPGAVCSYVLNINSAAHGAGADTNAVSVTTLIGCTWSAVSTNSWITILSGANHTNSGGVNYSLPANPTALSRTGVVIIAGQTFTITQAGAACSYVLSTNSAAHGAGLETNTVTVTTLIGCPWSVVSTNAWIEILSAASSTNSGVASYRALANPTAIGRTGVVSIAGQPFTVTQVGAACNFALNTNSAAHGAGAETNVVTVTTLIGCTWSAVSTNSWIAILSGSNHTNSGSVSYGVQANPTALSRTGLVSIAGQAFTITQAGAACSFVIAPSNSSYSASAATGSVAVTTLVGCLWNAANTNSWISILSGTSYTNSGAVSYSLLANPTAIARTGVVSVAGQNFTVMQAGEACSYFVAPDNAAHGAGSETGFVAVATLTGCPWSVLNTNPWITILSGTNYTNSGSVTYSVQANPTSYARTGEVIIANYSFFVTQTGAVCTYFLAPTSSAPGANSVTGTVAVTTLDGCVWSAVSTNPWINILSATNNTNSGATSYRVLANPTAIPRTGVVSIAGQTFTVTQSGANCFYSIAPVGSAHGANVETGSVTVATLVGCVWSAVNTNPWINLLSATNNTSSGSVSYRVLANPTAIGRTGVVSIAGQDYTVTQAGAACTFVLSTNSAAHGAGLETNAVTVTTLIGCTWSAVSTNSWIEILGAVSRTNSGVASYRVLANPTAIGRTGVVSIAGQNFTVSQVGAACNFALNTSSAAHGAGLETNAVTVTTLIGCTWSAVSTNSWIEILGAVSRTNSGVASYRVLANPTAIGRTGVVSVAGQSFTVSQVGAACSYTLNTNSASHGAGLETNAVTVTTLIGCPWSVVSTNAWIEILSATSSTNSGVTSYRVLANPTSIGRTGVVSLAGQNFTVSQVGAACNFLIASNSAAHGAGPETNAVSLTTLIGCTWTVLNTNPWISVFSATNSTNSGVVSYRVLANPTAIPRTGVVSIAGQVFTVSQTGAACSFALNTNSASHSAGLETNAVTVTTLIGCPWSVVSTNAWIEILSAASNTNSGVASYRVLANPTAIPRTGVVSVAGQNFTVTQAGAACSYVLNANSAAHGAGLETNAVTVTTLIGCPWSVVSTNAWVEILSAANNTNSGLANYRVLANNSVLNRTGTVVVAGQNFTVTQAPGLTCSIALQSSNWVHRALAESGVIGVVSLPDCIWPVLNTNSWVTISGGLSIVGGGLIGYTVAANNNFDARSGFVNIGGIAFGLTQVGTGCTFRVSPTNRIHGTGAASNTFAVTAGASCSWSVLNTNDWVTVLSNSVGVGNLTVGYGITKNTGGALRSGMINVGGDVLFLNQWGTNCGFAMVPRSGTHGFNSENATVAINASSVGCAWGIVNTNPWINITSATNGTGAGSFSYSVAANPIGTPRTALITIGGAPYLVSQAGVPCSFVLSSSNGLHGANSETGSVAVTTGLGCIWNVFNPNSWITITSALTSTNNGTVTYTVEPNPASYGRTGIVSVAGQNFSVSQTGAACTYTLSSSLGQHSAATETGAVNVITPLGCVWNVVNTNTWITTVPATSGTGGGSLFYTVATNTAVLGRTGSVTIANQTLQVRQAGAPCVYVITPPAVAHGGGAESGSVSVTADILCGWSVVNTNSWITITGGNGGAGNSNVTYNIAANPVFTARSGVVVIAGQPYTVTQASKPCTYVFSPPSAVHGFASGGGSLSVTASNECSWTVSNTNSWIAITSPTNGAGFGTVNYTVATNSGTLRNGNVFIGGVPFHIAQAGSLRIVRAVDMNVARGQTNRVLVVLESTGIENAVGFSLSFNTNLLTFVGAVLGIDATNQNAAPPSVNTSELAQGRVGLAVSLDVFSGQVFEPGSNVLAEVLFSAKAGASFATTPVNFTNSPIEQGISDADANLLTATYVPAVVNVLGTCTYALSTNAAFFPPAGGAGAVTVAAPMTCQWTAVNTNSWITITSSTNGTANGTVSFTVASNASSLTRSGVLTVAGQTFTVSQSGVSCGFALTPLNRAHGFNSDTGSVAVTSPGGCPWTVDNTNIWITITSATNGMGNGGVSYAVASNGTAFARSGVVVIADQIFTINQDGVPCVFTLTPTNVAAAFVGATGSVAVASPTGCAWTVDNTNTWVVITSATNGVGNGIATYIVAYNPNGLGRTGLVTVAGRPFLVTQSANTCPVTLSPTGRTHTANPETNSFTVTPSGACAWTVSNTNAWIIILSSPNGTGTNSVTYSVAENLLATGRSGIIRVSGRDFVVTQLVATCLYVLTPPTQAHGYGSENGSVQMSVAEGCAWTVSNTNAWVAFPFTSFGGGTNVGYTVAANPSSIGRTGTVQMANRTFTLTQAGAPCTFTLSSSNALHGFTAQIGLVTNTTLTGCRWGVLNTNSWITILGGTNFTNSGTATYSVASNGTSLTRSGMLLIGDQSFTVTQSGVPCVYTLNPSNRVHSFTAATNVVTVLSPIGCVWAVNNTNNWITILAGTNGTGTGVVTYAISANPASFARTGLVLVAGQVLAVTQQASPCVYSLSPTNAFYSANGDFDTFELNTLIGCPWTLVNTNPWVQIFTDLSGVGSASMIFGFDSNPTGASRTGLVQVAGQTFSIVQAGLACTFTLSATNGGHGPVAETNSLNVATLVGCPWTVLNPNGWISILSSANNSGSGPVTYSVSANPSALGRTGTVTMAGQAFTVRQAGIVCAYTVTPASHRTEPPLSSGNVTGLVSVASSGGCTWSVVNTNPWIAIKSGGEGTNNGLVRFTVAQNPNPSTRSGYLVIAGVPFEVLQFGSPCTYTLTSSGRLFGSLSDTGSVSVGTVVECSWTVNNTNSWISITSPTNGSGPAAISYAVQFNPGFMNRIGTFTIGDQTYTVEQLGAACSYSLPTNGAFHGALTETGRISVVTPVGCVWDVTETNTWISVLPPLRGTNSGTATYTVGVNVTGASRVGIILVGGQPFSVTQATVFCSFVVTPPSLSHGFEAENGLISVTTSNVCPWTATKIASWITINSGANYTGNATVSYSVSANPSPSARSAVITVAGQSVTVFQAGLVCNYTITPTSMAHGFLADTSQVVVTSPTLCTWPVVKTNSWITILTGTSVTGSNTVRYSVAQNLSASPRSSVVTIAGLAFNVTQNGAPFIIASNKAPLCNATWNFDPPVAAGNCVTPGASIFVVSTVTNLGCGPTYTATRIWDATDACGSHVLATQVVSVVTPPPVITCVADKTVECGSAWTFNTPSAVEFCGGTNVTIRVSSTTTNLVGMCGNTLTITRTFEATDSCSNKSTCSQTVRIVDTTPPVVTFCGPNKTVECGNVWAFDPPTGTDNCGGTNVIVSILTSVTNATGSCGYTATRTWALTDACTNVSICVQIVTAVDTTPPIFTCTTNRTVECGTAWNFTPPTAIDNCVGTNVTVFVLSTTTNTGGFCGPTFLATRTWQAVDGCGNLNFCSQSVLVVDTTPPVPTCATNKTIEFGQLWSFDPPTGTDVCGGTNVTITILSTVTNLAGFCGPTFSATRIWQLADACNNRINCAQTVTLRDTTAPVITCATNKNINCLGAWTFDTPTALDVASGMAVTNITIVSTVTNGSCGSGFTATRIWRATDGCSNSVTCSQTVFGRAIATVSGIVFSPTNYPATVSDKRVAGATLVGPTNTLGTSAADGTFGCVFDAASNVVITPLAPTVGSPADGVTTLDISLVRRHILNVTSLDTPYKLLAADVDGSGSISTLDLSFMRRLVLGITNKFPVGLWRFLPSDYVFPDMLAPWNAPTNRTYPGVASDIAGQHFLAVKLGDVNSSWTSAGGSSLARAAGKDTKPVVSFRASSHTNLPGATIVVQVTVGGFSQVTSAQGTLTWDPNVLRYAGTEQHGVSGMGGGSFGTAQTAGGRLAFSWDDPSAQGVNLPDGTVMFAVRFDVIGSKGSGSRLAFLDSVALCEAAVNFTPATFRAIDGQASLASPTGLFLNPAALEGGTFGVTIPTVSGKTYTLEYTDVLPGTNWTALPSLSGDGAAHRLADPAPAARQRFYRVRIE